MSNFIKILPVGAELFHAGQHRGGQMDNAPKNARCIRELVWPIRLKWLDPLFAWPYRQQENLSKTFQIVFWILFEICALGGYLVNEAERISQSEASSFCKRTRHTCLPRSAIDCHLMEAKPMCLGTINLLAPEFYI